MNSRGSIWAILLEKFFAKRPGDEAQLATLWGEFSDVCLAILLAKCVATAARCGCGAS